MSSTDSKNTNTATTESDEPQIINLSDDTLDARFRLNDIVFTRETVVRALMQLNIRVMHLDDEKGPNVFFLGDNEYNRSFVIELIMAYEKRQRTNQIMKGLADNIVNGSPADDSYSNGFGYTDGGVYYHEVVHPNGEAELEEEEILPGVDPDTRLTALPDPSAPFVEDASAGQMVPNPDLLPVLYTPPVKPKQPLGQRLGNWWKQTKVQYVVAAIEHMMLGAVAGFLIGLIAMILDYETASDGYIVRNDLIHLIVGTHSLIFATGIVFGAVAIGITGLVTHYMHNKPSNLDETILMLRSINLAVLKTYSWLFVGIIVLGNTVGNTVALG